MPRCVEHKSLVHTAKAVHLLFRGLELTFQPSLHRFEVLEVASSWRDYVKIIVYYPEKIYLPRSSNETLLDF